MILFDLRKENGLVPLLTPDIDYLTRSKISYSHSYYALLLLSPNLFIDLEVSVVLEK